jgi:hypothetical protein
LKQRQVLQRKEQLDNLLLEKRLELIKQKEVRLARNLAAERDFSGNTQQLQARWFVAVFVAVRVKMIKDLLETKEKERMQEMKHYRAAVTIQRWYKRILELRLNSARKGALLVIAQYDSIT